MLLHDCICEKSFSLFFSILQVIIISILNDKGGSILALIKCSECGREISDKASSCPQCGCPVTGTEELVEKLAVEKNDSEGNKEENNKEKIKSEENKPKERKKLSKGGVIAIIVAVVVIAVAAIAYYVLTTDSRNYNSAKELFEEEKFQEALEIFAELGDYEDSAEMVEKCEYELSIDGQFMRSLSKGLMARWAESDAQAEQGFIGEDPDLYSKYCELELEQVGDFADQTFDNSELEADAKQYIEYLNQAQEATKFYTVDYTTFSTQWADTYANRTILLKKFVDDYGLVVKEEYQDTLDDLLVEASAAQEQIDIKDSIQKMTEQFKIETTEDEWGYKTYKISMKNTTDRTFEYFSAEINLYDEKQVIVGTGNTDQLNSWQPGQEASVSAWFDGEINPNDYTIKYVPHYQSGTYYS